MLPSITIHQWSMPINVGQPPSRPTGSQLVHTPNKPTSFLGDTSSISNERKKGTWGTDMGTSSITADFTQKIDQIEALYTTNDTLHIRTFIRDHPVLADLLIEAYDQLAQIFGPVPQIMLSIDGDPSRENSELFGSILTPLDVSEGLNGLDKFDQSWFLDQIGRTEGKLNFNVTFL
jgi:hypothetical protein